MYWQPTPVLGVFDTELPQFTTLGFETNDRKVYLLSTLTEKKRNSLNFFAFCFISFPGTIGNRNVSALVIVVQTSTKYWIFRISNIFTKYFDCDAVMGIILDQP